MNDKLEISVQKTILRYLKDRGAKAIKITVDGYVPTGTPDCIGSYKGHAFALEFKRSANEEPTERQRYELKQWADAGTYTAVVWSLDQVKTMIQILDKSSPL